MNKEVLLTVLGVIGTLGGTLLGWLLNAYTYKIGRTEIRGTFETRITMPPARPDDAAGGTVKKEYFIKCCAKIAGKLQFFTVRIDTTDPEIEYVKLTLCAYDEDGKLQKFLVYNGLKVKRPPVHVPRH